MKPIEPTISTFLDEDTQDAIRIANKQVEDPTKGNELSKWEE